ncbi:MAG: 4Fe-4S binding protein [Lachnospiraceae bacterium]|nr:4Fe-4S binding protein [Lachnospiraceae bacterium]
MYPLFVKTTPFYMKDSCIGCGKCASLCPLQEMML